MANIKSAQKRIFLSMAKNKRNTSQKSKVKTLIKKVKLLITQEEKIKVESEFKNMQSFLDTQTHKGLIHKNKSARHKSRIAKRIQKMVK